MHGDCANGTFCSNSSSFSTCPSSSSSSSSISTSLHTSGIATKRLLRSQSFGTLNSAEQPELASFTIKDSQSQAVLPSAAISVNGDNLRRRILTKSNKNAQTEETPNQSNSNVKDTKSIDEMAPQTEDSSEELASFLPGNNDSRNRRIRSKGGILGCCGMVMRRRRMVLYLTLSILLASQLWLWGPSLVGEERANAWGDAIEKWKPSMHPLFNGAEDIPAIPPPSQTHSPSRPPSPMDDAPIGTSVAGYTIYKPKWNIPTDYDLPISPEEETQSITSGNVFPPDVVSYANKAKPSKAIYNYKDGDPHQGVIPPAQLSMLERDIPRIGPMLSSKPLAYPSGRYESHSGWSRASNGSKTRIEDAMDPDTQPLDHDWRPNPYNLWKPPKFNMQNSRGFVKKAAASALPRVQYPFSDPTRFSGDSNDKERDAVNEKRRRLVRNAFLHSWEAYKANAWGHDEVRPVSGEFSDSFNGWGATIVDALDTLLIMDLPAEYDLARQHVYDIDFHFIGGSRSAYGNSDGRVPVFETAIRYLGGFLSAYDLSGDELMRDRAEELAQLILPAFETMTGVPIGRLNLNKPGNPFPPSSVIVAEAASMLVEMTRLWQVTGNRTYFDKVQRTTDWLQYNMTGSPDRLGALLPSTIFPERGTMYGWYSWGGMIDSAFEYLIKEHQLLGGRLEQYGKFFADSVDSAHRWLLRGINSVPDTPLLVMGQSNGRSYTPKLEHLTCFTGGSIGMGAKLLSRKHDLDIARRVTETCYWAYNSTETGIGPEEMTFYRDKDIDRFEVATSTSGTSRRGRPRGAPVVGVRSVSPDYRNRPETIESVFYMWRITGDPQWQERGWQMFCSWVTHSMTKHGFAAISNVLHVPAMLYDSMESYVFAETFKYYYLLFSPPNLISLDEYVFSTEAHPLLLPKNGKWGQPGQGSRKFWDPAMVHIPATVDQYSGGEMGVVGGLTRAQKHHIYDTWQKEIKEAERLKLEVEKIKAEGKPGPKPEEKSSNLETIANVLKDAQKRASETTEWSTDLLSEQIKKLLVTKSLNGEEQIGVDRRELADILSEAFEIRSDQSEEIPEEVSTEGQEEWFDVEDEELDVPLISEEE